MSLKLIQGFGINNSTYPISYRPDKSHRSKSIIDLYYSRWQTMLTRVSNPLRYPTYAGCSVSEDFRFFMDYREWCLENGLCEENRKFVEVDKDILITGNKVYSKLGCCIVSGEMNRLLTTSSALDTTGLLGVTRKKRSKTDFVYFARLSRNGRCEHVGTYRSELEAHKNWQVAKAKHILEVTSNYESFSEYAKIPYREDVVSIMNNVAQTLMCHAESGKLTTKLK